MRARGLSACDLACGICHVILSSPGPGSLFELFWWRGVSPSREVSPICLLKGSPSKEAC